VLLLQKKLVDSTKVKNKTIYIIHFGESCDLSEAPDMNADGPATNINSSYRF
jgi:hypothetical protein